MLVNLVLCQTDIWIDRWTDRQTLTSSPLNWQVHHNQTTEYGGQSLHWLKLHIALKYTDMSIIHAFIMN